MNRIARFEKVSKEQFVKDFSEKYFNYSHIPGSERNEKNIRNRAAEIYENIKLPQRVTLGSAGYDFYMPANWLVYPGQAKLIPTGIRCIMEPGWVLQMVPRSSLGINHRVTFDNTISIIDSDYAESDNEGHIFIKLRYNEITENCLYLHEGDRIAQGIFLPYGITEDDNATGRRTGGIGSTGK